MATDYNWDENARHEQQSKDESDQQDVGERFGCRCKHWQDSFKKATEHCIRYREDIIYLRNVVRDCLIFAGRAPASPRAERRIHGIDFVASILDALQSAYDATGKYTSNSKEVMESTIREKIRKGMEDANE